MARITIDPAVMGGVPCLRGLRIPVATVVNMVAGGLTAQQLVEELPPLEIEDVAAALRFAADRTKDPLVERKPSFAQVEHDAKNCAGMVRPLTERAPRYSAT